LVILELDSTIHFYYTAKTDQHILQNKFYAEECQSYRFETVWLL